MPPPERPAESPAEVLARAEAFGVDLSLLRANLRRTPAERLARHAEALARVQALRAAADVYRPPLSRSR